ncbi:MAG: 30S ribosomal protein S20 [Candidatus Omnitrophota bacterium]
MPQRRSAKKELRKSEKRRKRNFTAKKAVKDTIKKLKKAIESKDTNSSRQVLKEAYSILDKKASKKIIHPNKASRKKSRLAKLVNKSA